MDFEAYLLSKKIASDVFKRAEPTLWDTWKREFDLVHPKSFTAQKLYLINPIRRKYPLKQDLDQPGVKSGAVPSEKLVEKGEAGAVVPKAKPAMARPIFRPKPKTN